MLTRVIGSSPDLMWIETDWPDDMARGVFTLRHGGVSEAPFHSLNVGYHVPDEAQSVRANREICVTLTGGKLSDWVVPEQVHSASVAVVGAADRGRGSNPETPPVPGVDALVTNAPGVTLVVLSADCVPLLFLDPVRRAVAAAHSGWRGTVSHIAREVLRTLATEYGSQPEDVDVWMGPSVRRCCYEVDDLVAGPVITEFGAKTLIPRAAVDGKYWLSLQACIRHDLLAAGVTQGHIHDVGLCSACKTDMLFSHRAEHGKTGRFMGAVRLAEGV